MTSSKEGALFGRDGTFVCHHPLRTLQSRFESGQELESTTQIDRFLYLRLSFIFRTLRMCRVRKRLRRRCRRWQAIKDSCRVWLTCKAKRLYGVGGETNLEQSLKPCCRRPWVWSNDKSSLLLKWRTINPVYLKVDSHSSRCITAQWKYEAVTDAMDVLYNI